MRILHLDIETSPNLCFTWGLWNQNVAVNQIVEPSRVLCWAAKWHGESEMMFVSSQKTPQEKMIRKIHSLLNEADAVIHYNGESFDIPRLNQEFKKFGMAPPAPYKQIDLFKVICKKFDLPSRKLEYVVDYFNLGAKVKHAGMELWKGCLEGDLKSWETMERYNKGDVNLLVKLYTHLLPWIDNHPNHALYEGEPDCCPNCSSTNLQKRGLARTNALTYQRYQCIKCGKWIRSSRKLEGTVSTPLKGLGA